MVSDVQIEEGEMGGACSKRGELRNAYRILVGNPKGKKPLGGPTRRWEDNIKMDRKETGMDGSCLHDNEHSGSMKANLLTS
jgi:hypothetical protein